MPQAPLPLTTPPPFRLVPFPMDRLPSREEAEALQAPLSRQMDALLAAAGSLLNAGQAGSPAMPLLLQAVEATKVQLAMVAGALTPGGRQQEEGGRRAAEAVAHAATPHAATLPGPEPEPKPAQAQAGPGTARRGTHKPAPGREGRWVDVMDSKHDGRRPVADMARLNAGLATLLDSLRPTPEELAVQEETLARVTSLLKAAWPDAEVLLFGSAANGLSVRGTNDLDICMQLPPSFDSQESKVEAANLVAERAVAAGMEDVKDLSGARIPVVKFGVPGTALRVDVTINNGLACANTRFLATYSAIDPRFSQLVSVVKHWAKRRRVNEPYTGTLSSYCYALMCLHLLQTRKPPVLPALQKMPHTPPATLQGWDVGYYSDVKALAGFGAANTQSLAELLWDFFEYWAWRHDYRGSVVSVRTAGTLTKADKGWAQRVGRERHLVCIEDPFELSHDLGRTVDRQTSGVLRKEFLRAATLLRDSPTPLQQLFERFQGKHRVES